MRYIVGKKTQFVEIFYGGAYTSTANLLCNTAPTMIFDMNYWMSRKIINFGARLSDVDRKNWLYIDKISSIFIDLKNCRILLHNFFNPLCER